jgi:hypothetical protein
MSSPNIGIIFLILYSLNLADGNAPWLEER